MKNILLAISMILMFSIPSISQDTDSDISLTVRFTGLKSDNGQVRIAICGQESKWMSDDLLGKEVDIHDGKAVVTFEKLEKGEYAISAYHDKNSNDKLDTNFLGIPKESYAFSNDARGTFGPASWKDSKFEVKNNKEVWVNF